MKQKLKLAAVTSSLVLASTGLGLASAGSASAAPQCSWSGSLNGGGSVCIDYDPSGYQASWEQSGSTNWDWLDFNLVCDNGQTFGDAGAFRASTAGNTYSYVFSVGSQGTCHVDVYDRTSGEWLMSPSLTR